MDGACRMSRKLIKGKYHASKTGWNYLVECPSYSSQWRGVVTAPDGILVFLFICYGFTYVFIDHDNL